MGVLLRTAWLPGGQWAASGGRAAQANFPFGGMPFMVGSVDEVGEQMRAMFENAPLDEMVLYFHPPGMSTDAARRAMTLFAREIMPEARSWGDKSTRPAPAAHW